MLLVASDSLLVPSQLYPSLRSALAAANPFDVISLQPGIWSTLDNCNLLITIPISIQGAGADQTILDCQLQWRCLAISSTSQVTLKNIGFRGGFAPSDNETVRDSYSLPTTTIDTAVPMTFRRERREDRDGFQVELRSTVSSSLSSYSISNSIGGCIAVLSGSQVSMSNVRISNCVGLRGAGLGVADSTVVIDSVIFENNNASATALCDALGSGLFMINSSNSVIRNSEFRGNNMIAAYSTFGHGPASVIMFSRFITISNISVIKNRMQIADSATGYPGGLALYETPYVSLDRFVGIENSLLSASNTQIEVVGGDIFCNRCSFSNFSNVFVSGSIYSGTLSEASIVGGGVIFRYSVNLRLIGIVVQNVKLTGNNFVFSAGIELRGLDTFILKQSTLRNNTIMSSGENVMYGGGMRMRVCNNGRLDNVSVVNNTAITLLSSSINGVGMYIGSCKNISINGLVAESNKATSISPASLDCSNKAIISVTSTFAIKCNEMKFVNAACGSMTVAARLLRNTKSYLCPWLLTPENNMIQPFVSYQMTIWNLEIYSHPECVYDSLSIFDGPSTYSPLIGKYCGSYSANAVVCASGLCPNLRNSFNTTSGAVLIVPVLSVRDVSAIINWTTVSIQNAASNSKSFDIDDNANKMDDVMSPPTIYAAGSGIYITQSTVDIQSSSISRNSITHPFYAGGAGLFLSVSAVVTLSRVNFVGNSVESITAVGAAIAVTKSSTLSMSNSFIQYGTANGRGICISIGYLVCPSAWGGAIAVTIASNVKVVNSIVTQNRAICSGTYGRCSARGGAMSIGLAGSASIESSTIAWNKAMVGGGVFVVGESSSLQMMQSQCQSNICECEDSTCTSSIVHAGGCIAASSGNIRITSSTLERNSIADGGGGAVAATGSSIFWITNCSIRTNTALEGGAIYQQNTAAVNIVGSVIEDNMASFVGGFISASGTFALNLLNTSLIRNTAIRASAIWASGEGNITLSGVSVLSSEGSMATIVGNIHGASSSTTWNCSYPDSYLATEEGNQFYSQQCVPCSEGTYTFAPAISNQGYNQQCHPCPLGGTCEAPTSNSTGLRSTFGFWGEGNISSGTVQFYLCPSGYCCPRGQMCEYNYCQGNRMGRLCGSCPDGMGFRFLTTSCVSNADCNDLGWVAVLVLIFSILGCMFLLITWGRNSAGTLAALTFFYQVAPLVKSTPWQYTATALISIAQSIFLVSPSGTSGGSGVCIIPSMTAAQKSGSRLLIPGFVIMMLFVMYWVHLLLYRSKIAVVKKILSDHPCWMQYLSALVCFTSIAYTTFALSALEAIQCIQIGELHVWWHNSQVICYEAWQGLAIGFFVILSPMPFVVIVLMYRWKNAEMLSARWMREVRCTLMDGFKEETRWWLGVSLYRRLLLVLVYSLVIDNVWKSMTMTFLCSGFLALQATAQPFNTKSAQGVEIWCLIVLCLLSISEGPGLSQLQFGSVDTLANGEALEWVQLLLYVSPGAACFSIYMKWSIRKALRIRAESRRKDGSMTIVEKETDDCLTVPREKYSFIKENNSVIEHGPISFC